MQKKQMRLKRLFDIVFSLSALFFLLPLLALIALLIKISSPGPCLYPSARVGRFSRKFTCWKFRTMFEDADLQLASLLQKNRTLNQEWKRFYKLKKDPRITPLGKWLRKYSLDELPQFYNVLRGDLSVVGPRPLTENEVRLYLKSKASKILSIRPGLTGMWQTSGRNLLTYPERIQLEEHYVDASCFSLDLFLILKTIPVMISTKGAF